MSLSDSLRRHNYVRPRTDVALTGVCAAIARGADIPLWSVRLIVVVLTLVSHGLGLLAYIAAATIMPREVLPSGGGFPGGPVPPAPHDAV